VRQTSTICLFRVFQGKKCPIVIASETKCSEAITGFGSFIVWNTLKAKKRFLGRASLSHSQHPQQAIAPPHPKSDRFLENKHKLIKSFEHQLATRRFFNIFKH
jgi:hypothetical protein